METIAKRSTTTTTGEEDPEVQVGYTGKGRYQKGKVTVFPTKKYIYYSIIQKKC